MAAVDARLEFVDDEVDRELLRFDVTATELQERVLIRAEEDTAREFGGGPFPRNAIGIGRWLYLVRNLNELLAGKGWEVHEPDGISRILHRERKIAIVVQAGDNMTGRSKASGSRQPRTRYARGAAMLRAVGHNEVMMLPQFEEDRAREIQLQDYTTWFLLVWTGNGEVWAELSEPALSESSKIELWSQRILLGSAMAGGIAIDNPSTDDFVDEGIDFPVTPR